MADHREVTATNADGKPIALAQRRVSLQASYFEGPLPKPEVFRQYEDICPGAADRILRMAELEGEHRRAQEARLAGGAITAQNRGQIFGFSVVIVFGLIGGGLLLAGVPAAGVSIVLGAGGTMLVGAIWNKVEDRKERQLEERKVKVAEETNKRLQAQAQDTKKPKKK